MRNTGFGLLLAVCLGVTGCAIPAAKNLSEKDRVVANGRRAVVIVAQPEIVANIHVSKLGNHLGLIGAIIDGGVNQNRQKWVESTVKSAREAVPGADIDAMIMAEFKESTHSADYLSMRETVLTKNIGEADLNRLMDESGVDQILFWNVDYAFGTNFSDIRFSGLASIFNRKSEVRSGRTMLRNALYYRRFNHSERLDNPSTSKDDVEEADSNVAQWAADQGALTRAALKRGFKRITDLFAADMRTQFQQ
jgi:hypothetical protein